MTTESGGMMVTAVMQDQNPSFLTEVIQLVKLSKELSKASREAIDVLTKLLESTDEKVRMTAAMKILDLDIEVKKAISQDQMQRLIAEIKLNRGGGQKQIPVTGNGQPKAITKFDTIQEV